MLMDIDPAQPLSITTGPVADDGRRWRVTLDGELDLASAPALEACLAEERTAGHGVELAMTGVRFIDSTGIRVIAEGLRASAAAGLEFVLRGPLPAQMRRVLEVSGLLGRFPVLDAE